MFKGAKDAICSIIVVKLPTVCNKMIGGVAKLICISKKYSFIGVSLNNNH